MLFRFAWPAALWKWYEYCCFHFGVSGFHLEDKSLDDCGFAVCFGCRCSGSLVVVHHTGVGFWSFHGLIIQALPWTLAIGIRCVLILDR